VLYFNLLKITPLLFSPNYPFDEQKGYQGKSDKVQISNASKVIQGIFF
jgi:hypothetical protein